MAAAKQTWMITGASSGLGVSIALRALKNGHTVIGTSRSVSKAKDAAPEFESNGGIWMELDPGKPDCGEVVKSAIDKHGLDVVINNAAYAMLGAVEDVSEKEMQEQMNVNYFGPFRIIRAAIPHLREKKSGAIVNVSSAAGIFSRAGRAPYGASKFALEALSESLYHELKPFGIKVLLVEPGAFRTPFSSTIIVPASKKSEGGISAAYKDTPADKIVKASQAMAVNYEFVKGIPEKAADEIVDAIANGNMFRLPLGTDGLATFKEKMKFLDDDFNLTKDVAPRTDASD